MFTAELLLSQAIINYVIRLRALLHVTEFIISEPIQIAISLRNPLKIALLLKDVELLWQFIPSPEDDQTLEKEVLNNEPYVAAGIYLESNIIVGQKIKSVILEGECTKVLTFLLTPLRIGQLNIQSLAYK